MSATTSKSASVPDESSATLDASHASTTVPPQPASRSNAAGQRTPPQTGRLTTTSASLSPQKSRLGQQNQPRTLEEYKQNDPGQKRQWADGMKEKFIGMVSAKELVEMMPSAAGESEKIPTIVSKCKALFKSSEKQLEKATNEDGTSKPLIKFLKKVFNEFPKATRPVVADTHAKVFKALFTDEHDTKPDITTGRPGAELPFGQWLWIYAGLVIELKFEIDIFDADGNIKDTVYALDALSQLGKSARSLLDTHGGCHVYVIAVFQGRMTRILRFDRGGFIATKAFDWVADQDLLPTFFYRLYNAVPGRMVGDDDTISVPSDTVKKALWTKLQGDDFYKTKFPTLGDATRNSLRIKASVFHEEPDQNGNVSRVSKVVNCLTFGPPLSIADGLFGRATHVYRVLLEESLEDQGQPLAVFALKDAWRQTCRRPELDYYDAIAHYCKSRNSRMTGMAQCRGSVDLADPTEDWNSDLHRTVFLGLENFKHFERHHMRTLLTPVGGPLREFESTKVLVQALYYAVLHLRVAWQAGVFHRDVSEGNVLLQETSATEGFLVDWDYAEFTEDGLKRFYEAFPDRKPDDDNDPYESVGKSLKEFTGTEPFMAIEILRAQAAANNNLAQLHPVPKDEGREEDSEMDNGAEDTPVLAPVMIANLIDDHDKMPDSTAHKRHEDVRRRRVDLSAVRHGAEHDLESVYWLLVWMLLRHTQHGHSNGRLACVNLFGKGVAAKVEWLQGPQFMGTNPLLKLEDKLRRLVSRQYPSDISSDDPEKIAFHEVRAAFEEALLAKAGWGSPESAVEYVVPSVEPKKNDQPQSGMNSVVGQSRGSKRTRTNAGLDASPEIGPPSHDAESESRKTKKSKTDRHRDREGDQGTKNVQRRQSVRLQNRKDSQGDA
ncbi:hypothetical protein R3P38DRAFT_3543445 [Favolaschia claudopus]|uniref:Protein kinase domain-containing protein n=1 Tax=Favolaschia claudopus TaxID=2862362 RepID=A0AAW0B6Y7_9AGAR